MNRRTELPCHIVEDLLPLYCENLTEEETSKDIEYHLRDCQSCKDLHDEIRVEQDALHHVQQEYNSKQVNPFAKLKKRVIWQRIIFFLAGAAICSGIFYVAFIGAIEYNSEDIDISYTISQVDGEYSVDFNIKSPEGTVLSTDEKSHDASTIHLYKVFKIPFDDLGEYPNQMECGFSQNTPFTDEDKVTFVCRDREITYYFKDLVSE